MMDNDKKRPKLLDLFCGAGGAGMGYYRAGFDVVGVDIAPQKHYPFAFIQGDALEYAEAHGSEFDAIHASPPCQRFSMIQRIVKTTHKWPDLIGPTRNLVEKLNKPWVIENVEGAPIRIDLLLCGSQFNLNMIRHRVFELRNPFFVLLPPCKHHAGMYDPWHYGIDQRVQMSNGMGIDWFMNREEVREAIPPAYTEFIGSHLLEYIQGEGGSHE